MGSCILIVVEITIKMLRSVALLFVVIGVSHAQYYKTMENLGKELFDNYNGDVKPEEKVNVSVEMYVRDVYEVNPVKGYMDMQITFRQRWHDQRLAYGNKPQYSDVEFFTVGKEMFKKMWVPDTFFRNERESHMFDNLTPNFYARVYPDGKVVYSVRMNLKLVCPMSSPYNTFDTVKCPMEIASYGWQQKDIEYSWKQDNPLQFSKRFSLNGWVFMPQESEQTFVEPVTTSTGTYSKVRNNMVFKKSIHTAVYCGNE